VSAGPGVGSLELRFPSPCQVMVFPGLSMSHEAFLTAAEFETQQLEGPTQLRLQVFRSSGGAGGSLRWW
jgi:hypothetical protein